MSVIEGMAARLDQLQAEMAELRDRLAQLEAKTKVEAIAPAVATARSSVTAPATSKPAGK